MKPIQLKTPEDTLQVVFPLIRKVHYGKEYFYLAPEADFHPLLSLAKRQKSLTREDLKNFKELMDLLGIELIFQLPQPTLEV